MHRKPFKLETLCGECTAADRRTDKSSKVVLKTTRNGARNNKSNGVKPRIKMRKGCKEKWKLEEEHPRRKSVGQKECVLRSLRFVQNFHLFERPQLYFCRLFSSFIYTTVRMTNIPRVLRLYLYEFRA